MASICPTVTAADPSKYREQMARIEPFAERVHIDLADGVFTPDVLLSPAQIYWPPKMIADLHLMFAEPQKELETLVSLKPNLVIIHAEAKGDILGLLLELQSFGIKAGVALLPETEPLKFNKLLSVADYILIFAGHLGFQGGEANMGVIKKIPDIRSVNPTAELGWDGGVNTGNLPLLVDSGIEIINVGSFIHDSEDPKKAYEQLTLLAETKSILE